MTQQEIGRALYQAGFKRGGNEIYQLLQSELQQKDKMIEEYARQEAIYALDWAKENATTDMIAWLPYSNNSSITSEQLYNLYLESKKQKA